MIEFCYSDNFVGEICKVHMWLWTPFMLRLYHILISLDATQEKFVKFFFRKDWSFFVLNLRKNSQVLRCSIND